MALSFSQPSENNQQSQMPSFKDTVSVSNPNKDFARWHLGNDELIEDLEHQLRGEIKLKGQWISKGRKMMNDDGIREIVTIIYGHANKFIFLSKLKEDDILDLMDHLDAEVIDFLYINWFDFEIDPKDFGMIRSIITTICYAGMTRGLEGWTMEQTGTSMTSREVIMPHEQQQKKGLFGFKW